MEKIDKFSAFVKSQMEFQLRQANRFRAEPKRSELHSGTAKNFEELLNFLESLENSNSKKLVSGSNITLSWSELQDVPEELLNELSITDSDKLDYNIVELIEKQGGMASLDRIIYEVFCLTGEVTKRQNMNARLYRMMQKELIYSVPNKKGVYSSTPITEEIESKIDKSE